jgi:superfamily II DNA/RNA helicase
VSIYRRIKCSCSSVGGCRSVQKWPADRPMTGRSLNLPADDLNVQVDAPSDPADFVHRIARTARRGEAGHSIFPLQPPASATLRCWPLQACCCSPAALHSTALTSLAKANAPVAAACGVAPQRWRRESRCRRDGKQLSHRGRADSAASYSSRSACPPPAACRDERGASGRRSGERGSGGLQDTQGGCGREDGESR